MDAKAARLVLAKVRSGLSRYAFIVLLAAFALAAWALDLDPNRVFAALHGYSWIELAAVGSVYLATVVTLAAKNAYLVRLNGHRVGLWSMCMYYSASAIAHYTVPGKLGYPYTAWLLNRFERIPYTTSSALLLVDFALSVGFTASLAAITASSEVASRTMIAVIAGAIAGAALLALSMARYIASDSTSLRMPRVLVSISRAVGAYSLRRSAPLFVFYALNAVLSGLVLWLLVRFQGGSMSLPSVIAADTVSFIVGAASFIPMGIGAQDASMLFFLRRGGLDDASALSVVLVQRTLYLGLVYALGLIATFALGLRNETPPDRAPP